MPSHGLSVRERLEKHSDRSGGPEACWPWLASKDEKGYGRIRVGYRTMGAHRVSYEAYRGAIPEGLQLDHLCRNTSCINPAHLEPVTAHENSHRGFSPNVVLHRANTCKQGHALEGENLIITHDQGRTRRRCRACFYANGRAHYARNTEAVKAKVRAYKAAKREEEASKS